MSSRSIRTFKFNHNGLEEVKKQPLGTDWPVVYLLTSSSEIYIGETSNARARMEQHLANPEREKLKEIHILFDDRIGNNNCGFGQKNRHQHICHPETPEVYDRKGIHRPSRERRGMGCIHHSFRIKVYHH